MTKRNTNAPGIPLSTAAEWQCAGCGEQNQSSVDGSGGARQQYVEDCQVCCRPSLLSVEYDGELATFLITAVLES